MLCAGIPFSDVNLRTHSAEQPRWTAFSSLSEVTSLAVEYTFLARASGALPLRVTSSGILLPSAALCPRPSHLPYLVCCHHRTAG